MAVGGDVRPFEPRDARRAATLLEVLLPYEPMTAARLLQYDACAPARIHERWWVLELGGRLIGWASAGLHLWTGDDRVGSFFVGVHPKARGKGHGARLFGVVQHHLQSLKPSRIETAAYGPEPVTQRFLESRGFTRVRQAQVWALDPREAELGELAAREERAQAAGLRLEPLGSFADAPEAMLEYLIAHSKPSWMRSLMVRWNCQWAVKQTRAIRCDAMA